MTETGALQRNGLTGSPLSGEVVIDAPMHIDKSHDFLIPRSEPSDLMGSAQRLGIQRMCCSSIRAIRGDAESGNNNALLLHARYPDVFLPYIVFKPNYPELAERTIALSESSKISRFKIHDDGNDVPYDDRRYYSLYEYMNGLGGVLLVHTWGRKHVVPMMKIAGEFPRIKILLGHSGIIEEEIYAEAVKSHDNIYLETCASLAWYGLIQRLVAMRSAERVLFGTDMPFMSPDQQIGRILFARITDEEKRKILGLNALEVFNLPA
jgi:predicted TIM-barrel fold metal-dependent hydrolase